MRERSIPSLKRPGRKQAGFTLLETTTTFFVLCFGVLAVLQMHLSAMDKARTVQEYAVADEVLFNEVEFLRAQPFDMLSNGDSLPLRSLTPMLESLPGAQGVVRIEDAGSGTLGLKRLVARVQWNGENGRRIERSVETLLARKR